MEIDKVITSKHGFKIQWTDDKVGFGEISFLKRDGEFVLDSEFMGSDFCNKVFKAFVDKYLPEEYKN